MRVESQHESQGDNELHSRIRNLFSLVQEIASAQRVHSIQQELPRLDTVNMPLKIPGKPAEQQEVSILISRAYTHLNAAINRGAYLSAESVRQITDQLETALNGLNESNSDYTPEEILRLKQQLGN